MFKLLMACKVGAFLQMPTVDQAKAVTELLRERSQVPDHVFKASTDLM